MMKKIIVALLALMTLISYGISNTTQIPIENGVPVFGSHLFNGNFSNNQKHIYNQDYKINIGDIINVKFWGAYEFESNLTVDSQGNIFIPKIGIIKVLGVKNGELVGLISKSMKSIFKDNVFVYADLSNYQTISLFVTGNVNNPGLYNGLNTDSILYYLDKAGGVNLDYGSMRTIKVLRNNQLIKNIDLYDFLLSGKLELFSFNSGDVVFVDKLNHYVSISGEVLRPYRFEYTTPTLSLKEAGEFAGIKPSVTNALVKHYTNGTLKQNNYVPQEYSTIKISSGDEITFLNEHFGDTVKVTVEGEHNGLNTLVLPKGSTLKDLKKQLSLNEQSHVDSLQIFRKSVAKSQKQLIETQLKELETIALTTSSSSKDEALVRSQETKLILEFIERARKVEPKGQIILTSNNGDGNVLEQGDVVYIPNKKDIVLVQGEVAIPGAFTYDKNNGLKEYIELAGDYNERANLDRILIIKSNGKAEKYSDGVFSKSPVIEQGDSILVLPKVESKNLQVTSVLSQILYHIAIATKVVLDL